MNFLFEDELDIRELQRYTINGLHPLLNVHNWEKKGFRKIADVRHRDDNTWDCPSPTWWFDNLDPIASSCHENNLYFVVQCSEIVKVGSSRDRMAFLTKSEQQPAAGTAGGKLGRLGRFYDWTDKGKDTDMRIRRELKVAVDAGQVSVWANPVISKYDVRLIETDIIRTIHNATGRRPRLNKTDR